MTPQHSSARVYLFSLIGVVTYTLLLLWLYLPALDVYFAVDDWIFLNYVSTLPTTHPWKYFSTTAIWFYRPLHLLQFGLTYHLAGLNATAFNAQLILMALLLLPLVWIFLRHLLSPGIATVAVLIFSIPSLAPDILFWKSNFNTLHYAIIATATSIFYLRYLDIRKPSYYVATIILFIIGWFTRESCINIALLLACIEMTYQLQVRWGLRPNPTPTSPLSLRPQLKSAFLRLIPFMALAGTYVILHRLLFRNLANIPQVTYTFVQPHQAITQLFRVTSATLADFIYDPLILSRLPAVQGPLTVVVQYAFIIPVIIFAIGLWLRIPGLVFAVPFVIATHIPTFIVTNYNDTRYLYFGSLGYAIFLASLLFPPLAKLYVQSKSAPPRAYISGIIAATLFLWISVGNFTYTYNWLNKVAIESAFFQQACKAIQRDAPTIPPGSVLLVENASDRFMGHGTGSVEMIKLLTKRNDIIGLSSQSRGEPYAQQVLAGAPHIFIINILTTQPKLKQVR